VAAGDASHIHNPQQAPSRRASTVAAANSALQHSHSTTALARTGKELRVSTAQPAASSRGSSAPGKSAATPNTAPSTATATPTSAAASPKKRLPRVAKVPGPLEQSLLPTYPCLARMPAEVKDLLLTVCFTRAQDAIVEKPTKRNGEDCTKLECPLLFLLKEVKAELHELAEKLDADCHYAPESHWSVAALSAVSVKFRRHC
jgi:hypothetical protein